LTGKYFK